MWRHCENTEGATEVNIAGEEGMQEIRITVDKEKPWKTV